jgi:hypothetical protein
MKSLRSLNGAVGIAMASIFAVASTVRGLTTAASSVTVDPAQAVIMIAGTSQSERAYPVAVSPS